MSRTSEAVAKFQSGYACSQAILCAYGEGSGMDHESALKVSAAFAGGMRIGGTCGAVTGALMAIGLKACTSHADRMSGRKDANALAQRFYSDFLARNPSLLCRELLGADLGTAEGRSIAESRGLFRTKCPALVKDAAEILESLFKENV